MFNVKYNLFESIEKFKVQFVAKSFFQKYKINYKDIFVSTMRVDFFKMLLTLVSIYDFECHQVDLNNIFVNLYL